MIEKWEKVGEQQQLERLNSEKNGGSTENTWKLRAQDETEVPSVKGMWKMQRVKKKKKKSVSVEKEEVVAAAEEEEEA